MGTVMLSENKLLAIIELNNKAEKKVVSEKINSCGLSFSKIVFAKIPRDARHNSKIDYSLLATIVRT